MTYNIEYFSFFEVEKNTEDCEISGKVKVTNINLLMKKFMKEIRGKNIDPIKGFPRYIKENAGRLFGKQYNTYGDLDTQIIDESKSDEMIIRVNGMTYPVFEKFEIKELEKIEIENFDDEDREAYILDLYSRYKTLESSNEPISIGDRVKILCSFKEDSYEKDVVVDELLEESLRNAILNKNIGDVIEYEFRFDSLVDTLDKDPRYAEYAKSLKQYARQHKKITSSIEIKSVHKLTSPKNEDELLKILGIGSKENLYQAIKDAMTKKLEDLNFTFYKAQMLKQINQMSFAIPKRMIDDYHKAAISKLTNSSNNLDSLINAMTPYPKYGECVKKFREYSKNSREITSEIYKLKLDEMAQSIGDADFDEFKQNCKNRVMDRLKIVFILHDIKVRMRFSDEAINKTAKETIDNFRNNFLTPYDVKILKESIIMNSYIKIQTDLNEIVFISKKVNKLAEAIDHINSLETSNPRDIWIDI